MEELHPRLAVDLGTTWTAACRITDTGVEAVQLGSGHPSMPSVVARDGDQFLVGEAAERLLDSRPGAGAREIKRRFGDTTPVVIDGQPFGADALMAEILRHVARLAYPDGWSDVDVVLTHPANWGAYKLELLANVGQQAGFRQVALQSEPVAAAAHFVQTGRVQSGDVVAVYDFGGGTFDAAVVRVGDDTSVLGTPQGLERLGGIDVDQMVFAHVAASLDGGLSQLDSNDPDVRRGVARLRAECTKAKEALSSDSDAMIPVSLPSIQTKVRITRPELEAILRQRIDETLATLDRAIASAGVSAADLAAVVLVGGSSQIPLVAERVRAHAGRPTLFGSDPKLVVSSGALEGALHASRAGAAAAGAPASPQTTESSEESSMSDAIPPEVAAAAAAAAAKRGTTDEVTATVAPGVSAAADATAAPATTASQPAPAATSRDARSRAPEPPPAKPTESRAGRIAGGVVGAAAAVAGGIIFHEQLASATGIDPQVGGDAIPGAAAMGAAAASAAATAASAGTALGDDAAPVSDDAADDDVDTQLLSAADDAPSDDSMDAFDDDPVAAADLVGGTADDSAPVAGDVRDAFAAAIPEPAGIAAEPDFGGNAAPPIDDFSGVVPSVFDPPVQPDTLGPKVGFTEPASRPATYRPDNDDDDGPQRGSRSPQPMNAPSPSAAPHPAAAPPPPPQMQPPTATPPTATATPQTGAQTTAPQTTAPQTAGVQPPTAATVAPADDQDDTSAGSSSTVPDGNDGPDDSGDTAFDVAKARLLDRVESFAPPAGATAAETADLKADLQQMIDRFEPRPGESTSEALAALRAQYDDRVRDFTQDQKIDALIDETRRDNAREQQETPHADTADDATPAQTPPTDDTPDDSTSPADDEPAGTPMTEIPQPDPGAEMTSPPPPGDEEDEPIELHFDKDVDRDIAQKTTEILRQMESERRNTFAGGIQDPSATMQFYANQQVHMAAIQQLVNDRQAVALETDGGMPSDDLLVRVNEATAGLVNKANIAMTQASQQYAMATGGINLFTAPPLAQIPVVMPSLPDPDAEPEPEPAPPPPPTAYEVVAAQVAAANQALQNQAAITGAPFQPIQVPMDPASDEVPDLAAINAAVTQQVAIANQMMAQQAAILGRPIMQVPIPVITLPDEMLTATPDADTATTGGSATTSPDEDSAGDGAPADAGEADAPTAYEMIVAQVAATNQALSAQAAVNGLPFQPIQVPMDPDSDDAPDLDAINASITQQVVTANATMASQSAMFNRPIVQVPIPTITLPDAMQAGITEVTGGSATTTPDENLEPSAADGATAGPSSMPSTVDAASSGAAGAAAGAAPAMPSAADAAMAGMAETSSTVDSGVAAGAADTGILDPFDAHMSQTEAADAPGAGGSASGQLVVDDGSNPITPDAVLQAAEMLATSGQPVAQVPLMGATAAAWVAGAAPATEGRATSSPDAQFDGGDPGAAGQVESDLPSIPGATNLPDLLGNVDATNDVQATGDDVADDAALPTIPDNTMPADQSAAQPAPLELPDIPDIDIPDVPSVPEPDFSQIPDLPDLPDLPDAPDFTDDGPSFGDDIGGDVTPPDPTSTDF